jgi:hypothetical protein
VIGFLSNDNRDWHIPAIVGRIVDGADSSFHEMWRFQVASQVVAENIPSFVEYPPMQAGAGFNIGDLKERGSRRSSFGTFLPFSARVH